MLGVNLLQIVYRAKQIIKWSVNTSESVNYELNMNLKILVNMSYFEINATTIWIVLA